MAEKSPQKAKSAKPARAPKRSAAAKSDKAPRPSKSKAKKTPEVASNYKYWRDYGQEWADEYDQRKKTQPEYHIQEAMLAQYFCNSAPAKILEFGCGVGRHLSYLSKIPELDVNGYDQSRSMVAQCARWASKKWIGQHVKVGEPAGALPYPDGHFDIVYTTEVLIHVRPGDLAGILAELMRIARWHVLHLEAGDNQEISSGEHEGCWSHDLVAAYGELGHKCEVLPQGYSMHTPYRVVLDPSHAPYTWPPVSLSLFRRMDEDLQIGLQDANAAGCVTYRKFGDRRDIVSRQSLESEIANPKTPIEVAGESKEEAIQRVIAERNWLAEHIAELEEDVGREAKTAQAKFIAAETTRRELEGKVKELGGEKSGTPYQQRLAQLESALTQSQMIQDHLGERAETYESGLREAESKRLQSQEQNQRQAAQIGDLQSDLSKANADHEQAENIQANLSAQIEEYKGRLGAIQERRLALSIQLDQLRAALDGQTKETTEWIDSAHQTRAEFRTRISDLVATARQRLQTAEESGAEAREKWQSLERHANGLETKLKQLRRNFEEHWLGRIRQALNGPGSNPPLISKGKDLESTASALLESIAQLRFELDFIKARASYRMPARWRRTKLYGSIRFLKGQSKEVVTIRALGDKCEASKGNEVWLLGARFEENGPSVPWDYISRFGGKWVEENAPGGAQGKCLRGSSGILRFVLHGDDPVLTFMKHPWSGKVEIERGGRREVIDLYSPATLHIEARPAHEPMSAREFYPEAPGESDESAIGAPAIAEPAAFREEERQWLERFRQHPPTPLAIFVPRWLGVSSSTRNLFDETYAFPHSPSIDPSFISLPELRRQAELILESGANHLVFSGGEKVHLKLARMLKKRKPDLRCDMLWHASYVQCAEDESFALLKAWVEAARQGVVTRIGTVKKGMERFFEDLGCRSSFVMNFVPEIPDGPSEPDEGGPHLGLWLLSESPRKPPYAMLAAVRMIPGAQLRGANFYRRVQEAIDFFQTPVVQSAPKPLDSRALRAEMARTHLTLYATFSECCPMLPLESLSVGTPCLLGPNSHLFEDNDYLFKRLVVPFPDRADVIAEYAQTALRERNRIVEKYIRYAPDYNDRAKASVQEFLKG